MGVLEDAALGIGQELIDAKNEHPGGFVEWVETKLPFGLDKAERLMAITRCFSDYDAETRALLPPAWSALYELTRLPSERLANAIEAGEITPQMTVKSARQLAWEAKLAKEGQPRSSRPTRLTADVVAAELMRYPSYEMSDPVRAALKEWMPKR